jgi:hypothetical protein
MHVPEAGYQESPLTVDDPGTGWVLDVLARPDRRDTPADDENC